MTSPSKVLVDGDVCCYMAFDSDNWMRYAVPIYDEQDPTNMVIDGLVLSEGRKKLRNHLKDLGEVFWRDDLLVAGGGRNNFRYKIYPGYKGKRTPSVRGAYARALRKEFFKEGRMVEAVGFEADDLLGIWATEHPGSVICSIDKDLRQIPGMHYHLKENRRFTVEEDEARYWRYCQIAVGDSTDSIPGAWKWGEVKVRKALDGAHTEELMQEAIVDIFMKASGDNWYEDLKLNGQLTYILRSPDDSFDPEKWSIVREIRNLPPL